MNAFYNENEPRTSAWLSELIRQGHIAAGIVDSRSIAEVRPADLKGHPQVHLFAGIGGWSLALRLAGIPDDQPVWTISCPCQPFSCAGKRHGKNDPRHLWPHARRLIRQCSPEFIVGEQTASADGRLWLDGVQADLEALGYAVGGSDLCAAGIGAPHRRQRLYWMAFASSRRRRERCAEENAESQGWNSLFEQRGRFGGLADTEHSDGRSKLEAKGTRQRRAGLGRSERLGDSGSVRFDEGQPGDEQGQTGARGQHRPELDRPSEPCGLDDTQGVGSKIGPQLHGEHGREIPADGCVSSRVDDTSVSRRDRTLQDAEGQTRDEARLRVSGVGCSTGGLDNADAGRCRHIERPDWSGFDLIPCRDGKKRRVESGTFPLVAGLPKGVVPSGDISLEEVQATGEARVVRLRGYGNSIVPALAAIFIRSSIEAIRDVI